MSTIKTMAINNLDYAELSDISVDMSISVACFTIKREMNPNLGFIQKGDRFSDFRVRVYDMFGALINEKKFRSALVLEHKLQDNVHTLRVKYE